MVKGSKLLGAQVHVAQLGNGAIGILGYGTVIAHAHGRVTIQWAQGWYSGKALTINVPRHLVFIAGGFFSDCKALNNISAHYSTWYNLMRNTAYGNVPRAIRQA